MELELSKSINQWKNFLRENGKMEPWKISEWKRYLINHLEKFSILLAWKEGLRNEKLEFCFSLGYLLSFFFFKNTFYLCF